MEKGSRKYCIEWFGMELRVDLANVVLPVIERIFFFQLISLEFMLSMTKCKSEALGLQERIGNPKYLPKYLLILMLRIFAR